MNSAKPGAVNVQTGSVGDPAKGGSGNSGSPTEPSAKSEGLQNNSELASLVEIAKQQAKQIEQLVAMNGESQRIIGKLGNEVGQLRKQQPAITPELKKQFKDMIDNEETTLDAVQLVARNTVGSMVSQDNAVMDAFFQARQSDASLSSVPFDEYRWQAIKQGIPLENLGEPDNAKVFLRQLISSRPVDIDAVKAAAKAEGAKEKEEEMAKILKEKGISALMLPSTNSGMQQQQQVMSQPLTDEEEGDKLALIMAVGARQISKGDIPQEKRLRYGIS